MDLDAGDAGAAGDLVVEDVRAPLDEHLVAGLRQALDRELVSHRAARHEQCALLAAQPGDPVLELVNGGIVVEHVVADDGLGDRAAHRGRGTGDGVGAQVDHVSP